MYSFLPESINRALDGIAYGARETSISDRRNNGARLKLLKELRLRANMPARVVVGEENRILTFGDKKIILSAEDINGIVLSACENSLYAYDYCIKKGFVAEKSGARIGLCGECVCENGQVLTIKNFSGLCVRFPNEIKGCGERAYSLTQSRKISSLLIISPPGVGKTTLLRDLVRLLSERTSKNVLVIDENDEIAGGVRSFDLGETTDVLRNSTKNFGFFSAVRTLSPDVIAVDELIDVKDAEGARFAALSGVTVICTAHGDNYSDIMKKEYLKPLFTDRCFDYCVVLAKSSAGFDISELRDADSNKILFAR